MGIVDYDGNLNSSLKNDTLKSSEMDATTDSIATGAASDGSDKFTLSIGSDDYEINYSDTTSLEDLVSSINSKDGASDKVFASIIENPDGKYNLLLIAKEGYENLSLSINDNSSNLDISFSEDSGSISRDSGSISRDSGSISRDSGSISRDSGNISRDSGNITGDYDGNILSTNTNGKMVDIQTATDATFKYNGITMTRSSNTIDDIQLGLEIKILKDDASANISISQDRQPIKDELENFVSSFNTMQKQLDAMTLADVEAGKVGVFNGDNSINSIGRSLRKLITERDSENGLALSHFGLEIDRSGKLSFNSVTFDKKMDEDPKAVADYFSGKTSVVGEYDRYKDSFIRFATKEGLTFKELEDKIDDGTYDSNDKLFDDEDYIIDDIKDFTNSMINTYNYKIEATTHKDGIFEKIYDNLKSLNSLGGTILSVSDGLSQQGKQLEENRIKSLTALNKRYDTMTSRFIQYDSMINSLNNSFAVLQQQITMAINGK